MPTTYISSQVFGHICLICMLIYLNKCYIFESNLQNDVQLISVHFLTKIPLPDLRKSLI